MRTGEDADHVYTYRYLIHCSFEEDVAPPVLSSILSCTMHYRCAGATGYFQCRFMRHRGRSPIVSAGSGSGVLKSTNSTYPVVFSVFTINRFPMAPSAKSMRSSLE